jgi:small subunit ribosomal protein S20
MPITKGAQKAHRRSERKRVFNVRRKSAMKDVTKEVQKAVVAGDTKKAEELMPKAYKAIDKAAKRGVIKENTAARKKSRLSAQVKAAKQ